MTSTLRTLLDRVEKGEGADREPGFWPNYQEASPMARAIQMPLYPTERWINGVLNAHIQRKPAGAALLRAKIAQEEGA